MKKRLKKFHEYFCNTNKLYSWWHEQDYHQHVHWVALTAGIVLAVYIVMIDEILSRVNY